MDLAIKAKVDTEIFHFSRKSFSFHEEMEAAPKRQRVEAIGLPDGTLKEDASKLLGPDLLRLIIKSLTSDYSPTYPVQEMTHLMRPKKRDEATEIEKAEREEDVIKRLQEASDIRINKGKEMGRQTPFKSLVTELLKLRLVSKLVKDVVDEDEIWLPVVTKFFGEDSVKDYEEFSRDVSALIVVTHFDLITYLSFSTLKEIK